MREITTEQLRDSDCGRRHLSNPKRLQYFYNAKDQWSLYIGGSNAAGMPYPLDTKAATVDHNIEL